ncbi:SGNH/GDSL hydrolase family protein [Psychrobacter sp. I-STPA10]|uniref:SGNH/GDSL hydrolase family protein n=1 Tax=Psychrobacter sp. I-STPA10 TaxID=2585769 RepID=UPI001E2A7FB0|nr:SGNH/GDSL hydrolase family protein [Psychrobacter sp. I-STPA10]
MQLKDIALVPIYLYQGKKLQRSVVRLPEAEGERHGSTALSSSLTETDSKQTESKQTESKQKDKLNLMIIGDSSAAGVGVDSQKEALMGQLLTALQKQPLSAQFSHIHWSLYATTGHTSFDILHRLYVLPLPTTAIDIMVIVVGVNDATKNVSTTLWQTQLQQIITIAQRKFKAKQIIFCSLPPMAQMPALPAPLNQFIAAKAARLDMLLQRVCQQSSAVNYFNFNLDEFINDKDTTKWFAKDGFHPSGVTYTQWGQQLAQHINNMLYQH